MPVATAAISRTASGRWRAVNMMRSAPTKGDQVMSDSTGGVMVSRAAGPASSVGGPRRGATRLRSARRYPFQGPATQVRVASSVTGSARPAPPAGGLTQVRVASSVTGSARPAPPAGGLTQVRVASSRPPLRPDEEQEDAERDAVDVVLRVPALDPPQQIAAAQRPRAHDVQDALDELAVDPPDQAREAEEEAPVEPGVERVEAVTASCEDVDDRERERRRQAPGVDRATLVRGPGEHDPAE